MRPTSPQYILTKQSLYYTRANGYFLDSTKKCTRKVRDSFSLLDSPINLNNITVLDTLQASDIQVILGERLDMNSTSDTVIKTNERGQRIVRTMQGREVAADLIVCL